MSYNIIGGSDGPTSIFLAGKLGAGWINIFGLIIMALVLLPNIVYAVKFKNVENKCRNKAMNLIEQTGRYCSMLFMVLPIGMSEFRFKMSGSFITYLAGNTILLAAYWFIWILFFIKQDFRKQMLLAILPICILLLSGITLGHILLIVSSVIFGIGHIYVTYQNTK